MFTVKFLKYGPAGVDQPTYTEAVTLHQAKEVYVECSDKHGRQVVRLSNILGESEAFTIGSNRDDVMFNKANIMNEQGRTVETV